jgi:hypothetical protein
MSPERLLFSVKIRYERWTTGFGRTSVMRALVYEATTYALPFIAAVAAGDVSADLRSALSTLLGDIAINGSYVAPGESHSGSWGEGVDTLIQQTLTRCDPYLESIEKVDDIIDPKD